MAGNSRAIRLRGGLVGALLFPSVTAQVGFIGLGVPMFEELCCLGCNDALSMLNLFCTTNISMMDGMLMGTTTDECRRKSKPWLETMAYCLFSRCAAEGYPSDKVDDCFTTMAVGGKSKPTLSDSLPKMPPTVELAAEEAWLNVTSLVSPVAYKQARNTYDEFSREERQHSYYAVSLYSLLIGSMVVCGMIAQMTSAFPGLYKKMQVSGAMSSLRANVTMPAFFGGRQHQPLPGKVGFVPGRGIGLCISLYVGLNIIFSAVSFRSVQPNNWYPSAGAEIAEYVGNRAGVLCMANFSMAVLFAGRNNVLVSMTGWGPTTFLTWHRWTSRVGAAQVVVHSVCYVVMYWQPGFKGWDDFAKAAADPFFWWGIIGTIGFVLATVVAMLPLRARLYEVFLVSHIGWVLVGLIGTWYHLVLHFQFKFNYHLWLYLIFAYWGFERAVRLVRIFIYSHVDGSEAVVREVPGTRLLEMTLYPKRTAGFGPGQHTFLYLHRTGWRFWENHPFSVAGWRHAPASSGFPLPPSNKEKEKTTTTTTTTAVPDDRPSLKFLIRVRKGTTLRLMNKQRKELDALVTEVYTEGPYGGHHAGLAPLLVADTVICIVGGVGITNALGYVQAYLEAQQARASGLEPKSRLMANAKRMMVAWSAREMALISYVRREFLDVAARQGVETFYWYTGSDVGKKGEAHAAMAGGTLRAGRMHLPPVIRSSLHADLHTAVVVCGPGEMADEATRQVVQCVKDGYRIGMVQEAFSW